MDSRGLDRLDRGVLEALLKLFGGGPVGLSTLAVAVGEERETVEEVAEPFLVREGLLARTPRAGSRHRPPGPTSASLRPLGRLGETDNRTCSGRDGAGLAPGTGTPVGC